MRRGKGIQGTNHYSMKFPTACPKNTSGSDRE